MSILDNIIGGIKGLMPQKPLAAGISREQLDSFRAGINPADYTTKLNEQEQQGFNNWANNMRNAGKIQPSDNFSDYDMQGFYKNEVMPYEQLSKNGYDQATINAVKQGLNGGNKDLATFIQNQGIRTPQTQEEIEQARAGNFNGQAFDPNSGHFTDKYKMPNHETFSNESQYYNDANKQFAGSWDGENFISPVQNQGNKIANVLSNLAPSNWDDNTRQKVLLASKFLTGFGGTNFNNNNGVLNNLANGFANGANSAYKQMENYQNYQNTKALYNQLGLDASGLSPVGDYSSMSPAQIISLGIRQQQNAIRNEIANTNDKTKRLNLIMNSYNKGSISADEAQKLMQMYGLDVSDLQESNDTKKTNSQIELNKARIEQGNQRIAILKQKVAQGKATQADKDLLNKLNIENKKLIIEQNKLINQGLSDQLNNGGNDGTGNGGGRPLGQRNGKKDTLGIL